MTQHARGRGPTSAAAEAWLAPIVARVAAPGPAGEVRVAVPDHGVADARLLATVSRRELARPDGVGREVLVVFERGDPARPIVVGLLEDPVDALLDAQSEAAPDAVEVVRDGERLVIEAREELVLRCGEASVTLQRDGRIVTRGVNVVSQASEQQRILGAVVKIN